MAKPDPQRLTFLGVSTGSSSINDLFLPWSSCLGANLDLERVDMPIGSMRQDYREFTSALRAAYPARIGALVTSHKAALFESAADLFGRITPMASRLREVGMIYWRDGEFVADANDPLSIAQVTGRLFQSNGWRAGLRRAVILGAGGAGIALSHHLLTTREAKCSHLTLVDIDPNRAAIGRSLIDEWSSSVPASVVLVDSASDSLVAAAGEGGLVVNATGMGKDIPGSPISHEAKFPLDATVWEFNYRFCDQPTPTFMETALQQRHDRRLTIENGWDYFVWGWLGVMSSVLNLPALDYHSCFVEIAQAKRDRLGGSN